jgi:ribosomal protein L37AE/L43A
MTFLRAYFRNIAKPPARAERRSRQRESCERCEGQRFLVSNAGCAICTDCGTPLLRHAHRRLRVVALEVP